MSNRMKRIASLLLAAMMIVSLAACGGTDNGSQNAGNAQTQNNAGSAAASAQDARPADYGTPDEILSRDFSKKITIQFAGVQGTEGADYNNGNDFNKWWGEKFNIEFDVINLSWESWATRVNTWINADDLPDWTVWTFESANAGSYASQDLIKKVPDDWRETYPNLSKAADRAPQNKHYEDAFGGMYYFFRPSFANNFPADTMTSYNVIFLRKDWAEQAGYDLSANEASGTMTLNEFIEYLRAVKEAGITKYPWYNQPSFLSNALYAADADGAVKNAFYKGEDGKYHWGPAEESCKVKETLQIVKDAYDEGLIYPEFYSLDASNESGYFTTSGEAAAMFYTGIVDNYDLFANQMKTDLNLDFWEVVDTFILTDENGTSHEDVGLNAWACNILSPAIDDEKMDRILTLWDYACTDYGQTVIRMGLPGVDWEYDEDGNLVNLLAGTDQPLSFYKYQPANPALFNMFVLYDDFSLVNPAYSEKARNATTQMFIKRADISTAKGKEYDWALGDYTSQAYTLATMIYADEYANLISKEGDFSTNYDNWVQEKMRMIRPVLDDMNATIAD